MKYAVLGAGAMGSTMASCLLRNGHEVCLWFTEKDEWLLPKVTAEKRHPLSGAALQGACVFAPGELDEAVDGAEALLLATSSEGAAPVASAASRHGNLPIVAVTKGFIEEGERVTTVSEVLGRLSSDFAILGGPMIAGEIAAGKPAGGVVGSSSARAVEAARGLASEALTLDHVEDVRGVELCGALKNVYAILVGVAEARGANLRALAFACALEEMCSLVEALGGRRETATGAAGSGDLYVTSLAGRNGEFGRRVGSGEAPGDVHREMEAAGKTVEGVRAAALAVRFLGARAKGTWVAGVNDLCRGAARPEALLRRLLE
jgi:glycerol-3-phosphate dehydrogenase (NAD(P)+)